MRILVVVKPNSKKESLTRAGKANFVARVNAPAKEGKANRRIIEMLSLHFGVSKSEIVFVKGLASREKIFEII